MRRFVVVQHTVGPALGRTAEDHFDWFFEADTGLRSFATCILQSIGQPTEVAAKVLPDHRRDYLEFEGEVSGGRGHVRRVIGGTFELLGHSDNEFSVQLTWESDSVTCRMQATFYRSLPGDVRFNETRDEWRLRLTP